MKSLDKQHTCEHEPDWKTMEIAHEVLSDENKPVCDVNCRKCGMSGSFILDIEADDIQWD